MVDKDEVVGASFEDDYDDMQNLWEDGHQLASRGGFTTIRQQDLPFGETKIRIVDPMMFHFCWVHSIQDKNQNWKRLVCRGDKRVLKDKSIKPTADPDNCPICEHVLATGNQKGYCKVKFYFRAFVRREQQKAKEQAQPDKIWIVEMGTQLYDAIYNIATSSEYMEVYKDEKGDPIILSSGKTKVKTDLSKLDIILTKTKTGSQEMNVEYGANVGGPSSWGPFTTEEKRLMEEEMPEVTKLVEPASLDKIQEVLFGVSNSGDAPEDNVRGRRKPVDDGDVKFE